MAASTAPAAKAGLQTILVAAVGTEASVEWGLPMKSPIRSDRVYIGDIADVTREWAGIGQQRLREEYTVELTVEHLQAGADVQGCEEAWWELVNDIEVAVRADVTLGGAVQDCRLEIRDQKTGAASDKELLCTGMVDAVCRGGAI